MSAHGQRNSRAAVFVHVVVRLCYCQVGDSVASRAYAASRMSGHRHICLSAVACLLMQVHEFTPHITLAAEPRHVTRQPGTVMHAPTHVTAAPARTPSPAHAALAVPRPPQAGRAATPGLGERARLLQATGGPRSRGAAPLCSTAQPQWRPAAAAARDQRLLRQAGRASCSATCRRGECCSHPDAVPGVSSRARWCRAARGSQRRGSGAGCSKAAEARLI
jgi:hypothetical protein